MARIKNLKKEIFLFTFLFCLSIFYINPVKAQSNNSNSTSVVLLPSESNQATVQVNAPTNTTSIADPYMGGDLGATSVTLPTALLLIGITLLASSTVLGILNYYMWIRERHRLSK